MSQLRTGVLRGGTGFISRGLVQMMLFGVTIVATRTLSVSDFGVFALATMFLLLLRALFYVGPYEYLLKAQDSPGLFASCFLTNLLLALFGVATLGLVYLGTPYLFGIDAVGNLAIALAPTLFLAAITAWYEAVLLRGGSVRRYYLITLTGDTAGAACAVILLLQQYGLAALVAQSYVRLLILLVLYFFASTEHPRFADGLGEIRAVLIWSRERFAAVLLNFTSNYGADAVLGIVLSPAATGIYRAANRIVTALVDLFAQPLQKIAQTNLSDSYKRQDSLGTSWLTMLSGVGAIAWSGLATLAFLANDLVPLVLGEKWTPAVPVVIAFCLIKSTSLLDAVTTPFLVCHDRHREMFRIQLASAIAVVVLAYLASPYGPGGAVLAVGLVSVSISFIYGAMVVRQSRAGKDAIADMLRTSAPTVIAVCSALLMSRLLLPGAHGGIAVIFGLIAAGLAFLVATYANRRRMLSAIGSLGHTPMASPGL